MVDSNRPYKGYQNTKLAISVGITVPVSNSQQLGNTTEQPKSSKLISTPSLKNG
jgi:hypothetical protein